MKDRPNMFHRFIGEMNSILSRDETRGGQGQKDLIASLVAAERVFQTLASEGDAGKDLYEKFIKFITEDKGNILSARVYFRERQGAFGPKISSAFRKAKISPIMKLHINYMFIAWAYQNYKGPNKRKMYYAMQKVIKIRNFIVENNLPLALNRAKKFWYKVPETHMEYMDHIQLASEGLITALDKFVPEDSAFGSVAIGRMTLNLLTEHNSTMIKFSPKEKRILYRANNAKNKERMTEEDDVTGYVGEKFRGVTNREISMIASASSIPTSLEQKDDGATSIADVAPSPSDTEELVEKKLMAEKLRGALSSLSVVERKVVRLRHGY